LSEKQKRPSDRAYDMLGHITSPVRSWCPWLRRTYLLTMPLSSVIRWSAFVGCWFALVVTFIGELWVDTWRGE
jgi:hypothetical protein